jgi:catalase
VQPSPALSQIGQEWPVTGRVVGIVADETSDLHAVRQVREAVHGAGMVPLVIAPHGGKLEGGSGEPVVVQRTFLTARSIEYDALLVSAAPAPAPDAVATLDAKAAANPGQGAADAVDPRVALLLAEAFRHCKAIGGWGQAETAFAAAGCPPSAAGIVLGDDAVQVCNEVAGLMTKHRVWDRFPVTLPAA